MTTPDTAREANILGALALALADRSTAAIVAASGQSTSAAAALSALREFLDRPTLEQLGQVLGLTHSGVVRLVDRLVLDGLVVRQPGRDGRSRALTLTAAGDRLALAIAAARADSLGSVLDALPAAQRAGLVPILDSLLAAVVAEKEGGAWICRLCDLTACRRAEGLCPTATAAAVKYGAP